MKTIIHIADRANWEKSKQAGIYTVPSLETEGFIHCSLPYQIPLVANHNFKGQKDLVLLEIDISQLKHQVKFEDLYNINEDYPHLYGPLNLDAVTRVIPFPPKLDGTFELPSELSE